MGKGCLSRVKDKKRYAENFDEIDRSMVKKKKGEKNKKSRHGRVTRYVYK